MTFEKITNQLYGARDAGYAIDKEYERVIDESFRSDLIRTRGERFVDKKIDALYDFDGDAYRGDDGSTYIVEYVFDGKQDKPLCWHRIKKISMS